MSARTTSSASRTPTAAPDRIYLVDLRGAQTGAALEGLAALLDRARPAGLIGLVDPALPELDPALRARLDGLVRNGYAASLAGADAFVSLAPGEDALFVARLLLDPFLPSLGVEQNPVTNPGAPASFPLPLPPGEGRGEGASCQGAQPSVFSRWRERGGVRVLRAAEPSVLLETPTLTQPSPASGRGYLREGAIALGLPGSVDRYWHSTVDLLASEGDLWVRAASVQPERGAAEGLVVLTHDAAAPLCLALQRLGADVVGASAVAALSPGYRNVLFVLRNARKDGALLRLLRRYGGDAVLTEACLLMAYDDPAALGLAAEELGRAVPEAELRQWRAGVARPAALLLGDVAASASRLFVHSDWLAGEIRGRYGRDAIVLPAAADGRQVGAHAAGLWAECCVWAVEMLAAWGEAVRLDLVCPPSEREALGDLAARLGVSDRVRFGGGVADVALFLAMRGEAGWSGALARATGVPCIASRSVVEGVDARCAAVLPDQPSPPLLAEAILALLPRESAADRAAAALRRAL